MTAYYQDESVTLHLGDCLDVLAAMGDGSIDAVVTDPPYGLEFMGREWDGADGFRRSLNEADAGRDSVFGRTSRTSPEYKTGKPSGARIRQASDADQSSGRAHNATTSLVARNAPEAYVAGPLFQRWCTAWAAECLRVLKPGGWLLAFGGTRTWHRLVCGIEDAGFEVRDAVADLTGYDAAGLMWVYGSGFPKSLDVSKAIDKAAGAEREVTGRRTDRAATPKQDIRGGRLIGGVNGAYDGSAITAPATEDAARWEGWGTALKPGWEPIACARKPLAGTVASNVVAWGTGALNIDGCRVAAGQDYADKCASVVGLDSNRNGDAYGEWTGVREDSAHAAGRWPPNVVLGPAAAAGLDRQSGIRPDNSRSSDGASSDGYHGGIHQGASRGRPDSAGGASRYFPVFRYSAKAAASERPRAEDGTAHPTVKPVDLMRWLVRLVTPPGGTVADFFAGSGTTGEACIVEGFKCILAEKDPASAELIVKRLRKPIQPVMFGEML